MNSNYTIKIKKRSQPEWLCWLLIVFPLLFGLLNDLLGAPDAIRYVLDLAWLVLLLLIVRFWKLLPMKRAKTLIGWALLFLTYTLLSYLPLYQSGVYYLWGLRNNFRFYLAFWAFCLFLTAKDVQDYLNLFDKLFWLSTVISLVQYFVLDYRGDYLGGIFGVQSGCNGYVNIFYCIVLTKSVIFYLEKKERMAACFSKIAAALVVAALAELKFFFVEVIVIIVLAVLFTDFSWRKVWVILGGMAAVIGGAALLAVLFPNFAGFLSLEWLFSTAISSRGYTSSGDINRLNAISVINERFLREWYQQLFGLGLGNCDISSVSFLNTPFSQKYFWLHYSWLSTAHMYLETGYIGLVFFFGFFIVAFFSAWRIERRCDAAGKPYCRMARIMAVLCVMIAVYNSSLRTEAGYMAYFTLAVPFLIGKRQIPEKKR